MDSTNTQQLSKIDSETLQQLQDEIQQEIQEILNQSNLGKILEKYGIDQKDVLNIQYSLDLSKIDSSNANDNPQKQAFMQMIPNQIRKLNNCGLVVPCPTTGNPKGCWICL